MMTMHRLYAGRGYEYLTNQVEWTGDDYVWSYPDEPAEAAA